METPKLNFIEQQFIIFKRNRLASVGAFLILLTIVISILSPWIAPYDPWKMNKDKNGKVLMLKPPSEEFLLGTTLYGRDVFSQILIGSQATLLIGFFAGFCAAFLGANIGLFSGYYGKMADNILMRITDIVYGMPFEPFIIVMVIIMSPPKLWTIGLAIILITWRTTARVVRSEVLSIKERPYITLAKIRGASNLRIIYRHIVPNILPLILVYFCASVAWSVIAYASISFLGFGDPNILSWGSMLYEVFAQGGIRAWWWFIPPGICLSIFIISLYMVVRAYEEFANPRLRIQR
jgi:peptide/nickel transport system permease protein